MRILKNIINFSLFALNIFVSINIYGNGMGYDELAELKNKALSIAKMQQHDAKGYFNKSENTVKNVDIDREFFLKKQKELLDEAYSHQGKPEHGEPVYVFVSFSMPDMALVDLIKESKRYSSALVIQGLVDNSLPKTLNKIAELTKKAGNIGGIQIDPNLFNDYQIKKVPAYIMKYNDDKAEEYDVVYGLGSIRDALEVFSNSGSKNSKKAQEVLSHV